MSRSHPPALLTRVERTLRDRGLVRRGDVVLCACSGGPDSTAMLHVLGELRRKLGFELIAHGVDHGLRVEAAAELALAADVARRASIPFGTTRLELPPGPNLQARARTVRFAALVEAAKASSAETMAIGHTADDRAETFVLRLLRGSGPRGLAVLPAHASIPVPGAEGRIVRPLIDARRSDVLAHLERHRIRAAQDPSNLDARFSRVRVRREVLPLLAELSPGIVEHLCALAEMLQEARQTRENEGEGHVDAALGELTGFGRAQRQAIEKARRTGRTLRLRVRGGKEIAIRFEGGVARIEPRNL